MVATLFPVAWTRARQLSEYTTQSAITENAGITMELMMAVGGLGTEAGSFAGDPIVDPTFGPLRRPDFRVHALNMENILVSAPRSFTPDRQEPEASADARKNIGAPWQLEHVEATDILPMTDWPDYVREQVFTTGYGRPQVSFEQRVYPPLRARRSDSITPEGEFRPDLPDRQWDEALDMRRFALAVFHRLRKPALEPVDLESFPSDAEAATEFVGKPREFDVYYVTLRRTQPSHRFAQQDPDLNRVPYPEAAAVSPRRGELREPRAMPADYDVLLPVPWRVQVAFPREDQLASVEREILFGPPRGVPTQIEVNTENARTAAFVVDFFQPGTPFIDEVNGRVYRVVKRRLAGDALDEAYVTLDREVLVEDIDDGFYSADAADNHYRDWVIQDDEYIRTVWVFPPPVQSTRIGDDVPVFEGKQPVVGIENRTLVVSP